MSSKFGRSPDGGDSTSSGGGGFVASEGTHRQPRRTRPPAATGLVFELVVIEGNDVGHSLTIDPTGASTLLIGSSPGCALRIIDSDVSSRHCSVRVEDDRLHLIDMSSKGGTRVNGLATTDALLIGGEIIRMGTTLLAVKRVPLTLRSIELPSATSFGRLRGESGGMREIFRAVSAVAARRDVHLLIEGERGTGKRMLAEALHEHHHSNHGGGSGGSGSDTFIAFTDRTASAEHIATTLFAPRGLVDRARGGTLFILEVSDLDESGQKVLAKMLQDETASVRIMAATRGERLLTGPLAEAFDGSKALRVELPPLRAREDDVAVLARHFWTELGGLGSLPDDFVAQFDQHAWPGNVRELRIAVHDRILHGSAADEVPVDPACLATFGVDGVSASEDPISTVIDQDLPFARARNEVLAEFERRYVDRALERSNRNVSRAAAQSGIAHRYFQVIKSRRRPV